MRANALRMDGEGTVQPYRSGGILPPAGRRLILLVHGYNNDPFQAGASYFAMRRNLDHILQFCGVDEARRKSMQEGIWELYWPGYFPLSDRPLRGLRRRGYEGVLSIPSYSLEVGKARSWVASGLARFLASRAPSEVFFIAHSLGCRVVLETILRLSKAAQPGIAIAGFLLMAGAVPVHLMLDGAPLGDCLRSASRRYSLHSWRDAVLLLAFPPGELLAGEVPPYGCPVATGLMGAPVSLWESHVNTKLGHSDYWELGLLRNKGLLSSFCAGVLGVAVDHPIEESDIRSLPAPLAVSILPQRHILSARLPGAAWLSDRYGPPA